MKHKKFLSIILVIVLMLSLNVSAFTEPESESIVESATLASLTNEIVIKNVEVTNGGEVQVLYRDAVYKGDDSVLAVNGEESGKYYTTMREINLKDPRVFNLEFTVPASQDELTDPDGFLSSIDFTYGGYDLSAWGNGNNLRGETPIITLVDKSIEEMEDVYIITAAIRFDSPWSSSNVNAANNIPYDNYYAGTQNNFGNGQNNDNAAWYQSGPAYKGPGVYELAANYDDEAIATVDLHIGPYDGYHSWVEINEFAQSLVEAITGSKANLDEKPIGTIATGTVVKDASGNYVEGPGVYVEVSILAYGQTDNDQAPLLNNYSRYNAIWNIAVSKDAETMDNYLKPDGVRDQMNNDPQALWDKYIDLPPEDIDIVFPIYLNNVHPDEVSGTDTNINIIDKLIEGGTEGMNVPYKKFDQDDLNWVYRPEGMLNTSYGTYNHHVKPELYYEENVRNSAGIDTKDILDNFIIVSTLTSNPDGKAGMKRGQRYSNDLNRELVYANLPETIAMTQEVAKWDPLLMIEWHGYVSQFNMDPGLGPFDTNFEADLIVNNSLELSYNAAEAALASTGYNRFHTSRDNISHSWEYQGTIYLPSFSFLYGCLGFTIELPHSNLDSYEAGNVYLYEILNTLINGKTAYYGENVLNQSIDGKPSTEEDNKYESMRKSTIMNKLEFKLRGVNNIDSMEADKYNVYMQTSQNTTDASQYGIAKYKGFARKDDPDNPGEKLNRFPDYLMLPGTPENQFNVAETLKAIEFVMRHGAKVSATTVPVTYENVTYPAGTFIIDMKQAHRNFISEILRPGDDYTFMPASYADIYVDYPTRKGFDCIQIWSSGLFDSKLTPVTSVTKEANITGAEADYIVFKSNSTDAVRFVNLLLSDKSSGQSVSDGVAPVWMLRNYVAGVGNPSDYVIRAEDLYKINYLVDDPLMGLIGCHLEGKYIGTLPKEAVELVEPIISINRVRTATHLPTGRDASFFALDDFLGFNMKNDDGTDYSGSSTSTVRDGANVVIMVNDTATGDLLTAIKNEKLGLVLINNAGSLTNANFGTGNESAPERGAFGDVALYGTYNVDDSIITANYANTDTIYAQGSYYTSNIPQGSKTLFKTKNGGAFMGGFQVTMGAKEVFQDRTLMFSTILKGGGITDKPVQSVTFGANIFSRTHYHKYYPLLATAIYAGAAGILDDLADPVIDDINLTTPGFDVAVTSTDDESGIEGYTFYLYNEVTKQYDLKSVNDTGLNTYTELSVGNDYNFKVVVADYAGNKTERVFSYLGDIGLAEITGISVTGQPRLNYDVNQALNLANLKVKLDYNNGAESVTIGYADFDKYSVSITLENGLPIAHGDKLSSKLNGLKIVLHCNDITAMTNALSVKGATPTSPGNDGITTDYFNDDNGHWAESDINYAVEKGLMNGMSATTFEPDSLMTRAMFVTVLWRYQGKPVAASPNNFTDVESGQWYTSAVIWADEKGIVEGAGNDLFKLHDNITREQAATILLRYAKWKGLDTTVSADLSGDTDAGEISTYALEAMKWASAKKIILGRTATTLVPQGSITRAEAATLLVRFFENFVK